MGLEACTLIMAESRHTLTSLHKRDATLAGPRQEQEMLWQRESEMCFPDLAEAVQGSGSTRLMS